MSVTGATSDDAFREALDMAESRYMGDWDNLSAVDRWELAVVHVPTDVLAYDLTGVEHAEWIRLAREELARRSTERWWI